MDNIRFLQYLLIFNFQIKNIDSSDREKKIRFINDMLDFMKSNNIDDVQIRRQLYLENEDVYSLFRVKRTKIKEVTLSLDFIKNPFFNFILLSRLFVTFRNNIQMKLE